MNTENNLPFGFCRRCFLSSPNPNTNPKDLVKKRMIIFIFLLVVLFFNLNFISAVWWNPGTWFDKKVQLSPTIDELNELCRSVNMIRVCNPGVDQRHCDRQTFEPGSYFGECDGNINGGTAGYIITQCSGNDGIYYDFPEKDIMGVSCSFSVFLTVDCDGDGASNKKYFTDSATGCPLLDCDDNDASIFPGSSICAGNSNCEKCGSNGNFNFDVHCNLPNDGDCKMCEVDRGLIDDNTDSQVPLLFNPCYKCYSGIPTYDKNINPANDGDCKKCDSSTMSVAEDNSDSEVGECYKCILGTKTYDALINLPNNGKDCKKCTTSGIREDLTDNSLDPDCQKCILGINGGEVLDSNSDPIADDCWTCSEGAKIVNENDFPINDGDCKKCDSSTMSVADDNSDYSIGPCDKCISGTRTYDALINPANDGDCKKCAPGNTPSEISKLIEDLTDSSLDPDCQKCILGINGGEVLDSNSDVVAGDCWTCSEGAKIVNENDFPINDGDCKKCDPVTFATINDDSDKPKSYNFPDPAFYWLQGAPMGCVECVNQLPNFDATLNPPNDGDCKKCDAASLMMLNDNRDSSLIGTCKKCELSNAVDIPDGGGCNALASPSMCCGEHCYRYSSNSQQQRSVCCGGHHYTLHRLIDKRRFNCCDGNFLYLADPNSCGSCDKKCSGSTPYCHMSSGIFEDCYKCAECRNDRDCPSGKVCFGAAKKCLRLWPPNIRGMFTSTITASSAADAINIIKSRLGYSSNTICSSGGIETMVINVIGIVPRVVGLPPYTSYAFTITYTVTVVIVNSGGTP